MDRVCDFCNKQGKTRDACFKLKGFPEWFTKKFGVPSKLAAHVSVQDHAGYEVDDPLECNVAGPAYSNHNNTAEVPDSDMMQSIMHEVMRPMKGDQIVRESSNNFVSYANCASISLTHISTSAFDIWIVDFGATDPYGL